MEIQFLIEDLEITNEYLSCMNERMNECMNDMIISQIIGHWSLRPVTSNRRRNDLDDPVVLKLLLPFALSSRKKMKWLHKINETRDEFGEYHRLCVKLSSFEDCFYT